MQIRGKQPGPIPVVSHSSSTLADVCHVHTHLRLWDRAVLPTQVPTPLHWEELNITMPIAHWEHCGSRSNALAQGQTVGTLTHSRTFLSMQQTMPEQPRCSRTARQTPGCRASREKAFGARTWKAQGPGGGGTTEDELLGLVTSLCRTTGPCLAGKHLPLLVK